MSVLVDDDLWSAIGDPTRRRILDLLLVDGDGTATTLSEQLPVTRQAVAKHLGVLDRVLLVRATPAGRERRYRVDEAQLARAVALDTLEAACAALSPEQVTATELAGEPITAKLTEAPGNGASIGGLKVTTENAWFAARPSGTEDVYKIYAESFRGPGHLAQVQAEARDVVSAALG